MNAPRESFTPSDPAFEARCRASFGRQRAMALIGARMAAIGPGWSEVALAFRDDLTQQKAFLHGGIIGMIADSACGYAAFSLMPADASLVTVEYKINLLTPGLGESFLARGEVVRPGRTLSVTRAEVWAERGGQRTRIATMQQTLMMLAGTPDTPEPRP